MRQNSNKFVVSYENVIKELSNVFWMRFGIEHALKSFVRIQTLFKLLIFQVILINMKMVSNNFTLTSCQSQQIHINFERKM